MKLQIDCVSFQLKRCSSPLLPCSAIVALFSISLTLFLKLSLWRCGLSLQATGCGLLRIDPFPPTPHLFLLPQLLRFHLVTTTFHEKFVAYSLLRLFTREPEDAELMGSGEDGSWEPVESLTKEVRALEKKEGEAHESLAMVWTWYGYGVDVDVPFSVLPLADCCDGLVLAARFSAALVWNDGRPFT